MTAVRKSTKAAKQEAQDLRQELEVARMAPFTPPEAPGVSSAAGSALEELQQDAEEGASSMRGMSHTQRRRMARRRNAHPAG